LKLGIAPEQGRPSGERMVNHVLGRFSEGEKPALQQALSRAIEAVRASLADGLESAMNIFNRKEPMTKTTPEKP
jgi:peptidyl-tRNA hydrolase, PTH1 family